MKRQWIAALKWKKVMLVTVTLFVLSATIAGNSQSYASERLRDRNQNQGIAQSDLSLLSNDDILEPTYGKTLAAYKQKGYKPAEQTEIHLQANNYSAFEGAKPGLKTIEDHSNALIWEKDTKWLEWTVDVKSDGLYNLAVNYYPMEGKRMPIQRELLIDGKSPFREAQRIYFMRSWLDRGDPVQNNQGDDVRPKQIEKPQWLDLPISDGNGQYAEPFQYYLTAGKHVVRFVYLDEPVALGEIRVTAPEQVPAYKDVEQTYQSNGYKPVEQVNVKVQAEDNPLKSDPTIRRESNGDPLMEPVGNGRIKLNAFGDWRWRKGGQSAAWTFSVPKDGLYKIGLKFGQWWGDGLPSYRQILIDGKVPFKELEEYPFSYSRNWRIETLHDQSGNKDPLLFYLPAGEHTITMVAEVGPYQGIVESLTADTQKLSDLYRRIIMITGPTPDPNFEYELDKKAPELIDNLKVIADDLLVQMNALNAISEKEPSAVNSLRMINATFEKMIHRPDSIPRQLSELANSQTNLSTLLMGLQNVPLVMDYLLISAPDTQYPKVKSNFWQKSISTIKNFFASFTKDYTGVGSVYGDDETATAKEEDSVINVWVSRGKEWAEIMKEMAEEDFTPNTGIRINVNTLPAGQLNSGSVNTLLLAASSGNAPDVATGVEAHLPVEFAIRDASVDLSQFSDYKEVSKRFLPGALIPFQYNGGNYALPENQDFNVLVYRKDIMKELGVSVPQTWEDVYSLLPVLQQNGMQMYYPITSLGFMPFLYQNGGEFYHDDGKKSGLDTPEAFQAFTEWTELYTNYKFPVQANFFNRFRTGEMPIGICDYQTYVLLSTAAPELVGRWGVAPAPGHMKQDGSIDRTNGGAAQSVAIFKQSTHQKEAWEFIKWWTSKDSQVQFGQELEALLGVEARWNTANVEAFSDLPWPDDDLKALTDQWKYYKEQPYVLGGYFTGRNVDNAWNRVVLGGENTRESFEQAIKDINKELEAKQKEFGVGPD
ncbi:extracellular solute-binding protein [Paenibacillus sp. OV219]|uniref:extracellular solute-binding protein n=1 Tax=Paenibacillus sp. OV219 TaxID=1884377 RepID=UPI0008C8BCDF|nr:extracellular solute-binding protein [Paenibacillus sp. OV219]SEM60478.1 ABC-type glycerol-3-phosphate transport system, substrate-binding protein [Paenibacillus sp. OV219]